LNNKTSNPIYKEQSLFSSRLSLVWELCFSEIWICNNPEKKRCKAVAFPTIVFYFCRRHIELRKCNFILVRRT